MTDDGIIERQDGYVDIPVTARWGWSCWLLTFAVPCPFCGRRHSHGGQDGPKPDGDGHRGAHCTSWHRPFSDDCVPERNKANQTVCRATHRDDNLGGYFIHVIPSPEDAGK